MGDLSDNSSVEGELKSSGNDDILVDKAEEEHVDTNAELHPHMSDSPAKIEGSGNCINLFVEVFGPLDEIDEGYDDLNSRREHLIPGSRESDQEYAPEENGTMSNDVRMASFKNEDECAFNVSDLVWVKTRTQTWWPGTICDPSSDAAKDATKAEKKGPFLVKYFGNPYFTWCSNSDLRPFVEYFEQLSQQNDSRNFLGSVDKAVGEIGRQVKSKMTCRCFLKESHTLPAHFSSEDTEKSQTPMDNTSKFDDLYFSQFKPASFCSYIRNLASGFSVPNKVELIVAKNHLSAFYCSIGHCQLPLQLLRSSCDTPQNTQDNLKSKAINEGQNTSGSVKGFEKSGCDDDLMSTGRKRRKNCSDGKFTSSGKESELRERKKSKYLSYPYVEGDQNGEVSSTAGQNIRDDPKNLSCGSGQSTPLSKLTGKNSREKGSRNSFKGRLIVSKADNIDTCSAQLLSELHSFALGCLYPGRSKYSDSLKQFYCSFRTFAFLDFEMAHGILKSQKMPTDAIAKVQKKGKGKGKVKESGKNQGINSESVIDNASNKEPEKDNQQEKGSSKHVKVKKKVEVLLSASMEPAGNLLNMSDTTSVNNSCVITFQPQGSDFPKNKTSKKRKKREASPTHLQLETGGSDILKKKTPKKRKKGEASPTLLQLETKGSDIPKNETSEKNKKGEGSPTHLCLETQGSDIPKNKTAEKRKKEEASPTHLQLEMQGSDIPKNETPMNERKGEASPTHLQLETQGTDIPKNKTPEKREKGEAGPTHLQFETQDSDIQKNIAPEKEKKGEASPTHLQFETQDSDIQKNTTPEKEKEGEASPTHLQFETTARLPDLNGNILSISVGNMPFGISAMHQDTQNINGTEQSSSSGYTAIESTPNLIHNAIGLSFHNSLQKILLPSNGKPERKKWKRKETSQVASVIPDLNGTTVDSPSLEKIPPVEDLISPEGDHPRKKRRISRPNEDPGAMILLNFALEHPLPSKETLVATFARFGLLKESETQFLDDSNVQIFYERTTDAQFAIRRLEKNNPFGESLVSFKFHPVPLTSTMEMKETTTEKATSTTGKNHKKLHLRQPFPPADKIKVPSPQKGDAPNLTFIKKNVEMMKMTLEKAGDNLSPEMRAKLENEIKGFLNKIALMESASSP